MAVERARPLKPRYLLKMAIMSTPKAATENGQAARRTRHVLDVDEGKETAGQEQIEKTLDLPTRDDGSHAC